MSLLSFSSISIFTMLIFESLEIDLEKFAKIQFNLNIGFQYGLKPQFEKYKGSVSKTFVNLIRKLNLFSNQLQFHGYVKQALVIKSLLASQHLTWGIDQTR